MADIKLKNASYLKTAFAKDAYGSNVVEKTTTIAAKKNAILAINGDFYGVQEKGYVLKNGVIYRNTVSSNKENLVIYKNGKFEIIKEREESLNTLLKNGAYNLLSFGPALLINNELQVDRSDKVMNIKVSNPRTAIGIIDDLHYVFVVCDGRTEESKGLTLYQFARFLEALDIDIAYNLDGGGSSTMYFNGKLINIPTQYTNVIGERGVSDIVYIGY